jgi:hypothetical protein
VNEQEKPLTRDDVLKLIEENGGKAEGLDLTGRNLWDADLSRLNLDGIIMAKATLVDANLQGASLGGANLYGAKLMVANLQEALLPRANLQKADLSSAKLEEAYLNDANLEGASLRYAKLREADLRDANLRGAGLFYADLQGADLQGANFQGARLRYAKLQQANLGGAHWGPRYMFLGPQYKVNEETQGEWPLAESTYRYLKKVHSEQGMYDIAGDFFFREMTAKRKQMKWWSLSRAWSKLVSLICGYGEIPERTVAWGACWLLGLALLYWLSGAVWPFTLTLEGLLASLYYSAVSFTSLGYGPWFKEWWYVQGWAQGLGAFESLMGAFTIALFLVTFTRKMTR